MDIIGSLIYLFLIIVFICSLGVIAYIVYDYYNYKKDATSKIESTINNLSINTNKIDDITKNSSNLGINFESLTKVVTNNDLLVNSMDSTIKTNTSNIVTFDANLKNFFNFSENGSNINNGLFEYYMFSGNTDKNLELINKTTAIAGMTINTDASTNAFNICDSSNKLNCIKMNNINGNFMISPSNNYTSNIYFKNNNDNTGTSLETVLKIDLTNNTTYFNGNDNIDSTMYIDKTGMYLNKPIHVSEIKLKNQTVGVPENEMYESLNYSNYSNLLYPSTSSTQQ